MQTASGNQFILAQLLLAQLLHKLVAGNQCKNDPSGSTGTLGFFPRFTGIINFPGAESFGSCFMEVVYFIGAFLLLVALIYGTLNWRYRDKRKARVTDQIVRDRYNHNRT